MRVGEVSCGPALDYFELIDFAFIVEVTKQNKHTQVMA
jgi:hypothetical protein